ncbi:hypothetical protein LR948_13450 [Roseivivax sp. GX 12232]|uniref:hypothetical protein n=1 Tax=Roseivivax sp. GX 12232 TaxID=2900547 RepID=UPI001E5403EC|nr:hypothetical protein [Roseivivax sp. GX 12232]MCE0506371.1 hypothetical protein [Roseivivax sp. GX 12232]
MKTVEVTYGRYRLLSAKLGERFVARAFYARGGKRRGIVAEAEGDGAQGALDALRGKLDDLQRRQRSARRRDETLGFDVPSVSEFEEALGTASLSKIQWRMLEAHAKTGADGMTAGELASAGGYSDFEVANSIYGRAGRLVAEAIDVVPPMSTTRSEEMPTGVLAGVGKPRKDTGNFVWVMHAELREALETIGSGERN